MRHGKHGPSQITGKPIPIDSKVQKKWLPANFKLEISGLDCSRVNKVDSFTVKQKVIDDGTSNTIIVTEVPDLDVTLPEAYAQTWYDWHEDFVIKGNNDDRAEKTGSLTYLAPDLKEVLFTLQFRNLGIFKVSPEKIEAGSENIRRIKAEMYCEDVRFSYGAASTPLGN